MTGRRFGSIRKLPDHVSKDGKRSKGRYQVRYQVNGKRYTARREEDNGPRTFATAKEAREFLSATETAILKGAWHPPGVSAAPEDDTPLTFGLYAEGWLAAQRLSPSTRLLYRQLLDHWILPEFRHVLLTEITPMWVRKWHAEMAVGATAKANAYARLRTIMGEAVEDRLIAENPCKIKRAGPPPRNKKIKPATAKEIKTITEAMPEHLRMLVQLAAWCHLRWSEATALYRSDVDFQAGVIHVRRAVVRGPKGKKEKPPKSEAGTRDVPIPPHLVDPLREHLERFTQPGPEGLLFPAADGGWLASITFGRPFYRARELANRPDLTYHGLRHSGLTHLAQTGATIKELMTVAGHSTPEMAMRYQHSADYRQAMLAAKLSAIASGD
jgi:integrase